MDGRPLLHACAEHPDFCVLRKEILLPYRPVHIGTKGLRPAEKVKAVLLRVLGVKGVCELFYRLHKTTLV